jgi:hypothetical protein
LTPAPRRKHFAAVAAGTHSFRDRKGAEQVVDVWLVVVRLPERATDMLITYTCPHTGASAAS